MPYQCNSLHLRMGSGSSTQQPIQAQHQDVHLSGKHSQEVCLDNFQRGQTEDEFNEQYLQNNFDTLMAGRKLQLQGGAFVKIK